MSANPIYDQMHGNSISMDAISEGYVKNVAFISLRISLISYFKTAKALNRYMNAVSIRSDMTQTEKDNELGLVYAHESYNAIFHFHNFMELVIKDIRYQLTQNNRVYEKSFADNLSDLIAGIDGGSVSSEYHFIKNYELGIKAINKLRNDSVHSGEFILRSESLDELFGKYALPFMVEISSLPLFSGNKYWKYNLDNENIHPIEDIIDEYKKPAVNHYKIQLLKLIATAAFNNEIFITKKQLEEAEQDVMKMGIAAVYGFLYNEKVKKAEKEAEKLANIEMMDARVCPVCQNKTLVLKQDTYDDDNGNFGYYTYDVYCTQCGFQLDHYMIGRIKDTGVNIENYADVHA